MTPTSDPFSTIHRDTHSDTHSTHTHGTITVAQFVGSGAEGDTLLGLLQRLPSCARLGDSGESDGIGDGVRDCTVRTSTTLRTCTTLVDCKGEYAVYY